MPTLPAFLTTPVAGTVLGLLLLGAGIGLARFYDSIFTTRAQNNDERAKARDELWKELASVREQVGELRAEVNSLRIREVTLLRDKAALELANETLVQRVVLAERNLDAARVEAALWRERYEKLEGATGRFSAVQPVGTAGRADAVLPVPVTADETK